MSIGIPNLIFSLEMVIFACVFSWSYGATEYKYHPGQENGVVPLGHGGYHGGFLGIKAYGQALNISDVIGGILGVVGGCMAKRSASNDARAYETTNDNEDRYRLDGYEANGFAEQGAPVPGKDWREDVQEQQTRWPRRERRLGRRHRGGY
jgi:hypothetical protein